jgi:hypothetical protein
MHVPVQGVRQQTPCAHVPLAHSLPSVHGALGALRPHEPLLHTAGATQSPSTEHAAWQVEAPHRYGAHEIAAGVTHAPAPSHVEPGVYVVPPPGQLAPAHGVPCGYLWQAPPSHMPFVPHVDALWARQAPEGSGAPVGTSAHWPIVATMAHERHAPAQAVAQHTPCAQKPEPHSMACEQNAPIGLTPQLPAAHVFGAPQSPLVRHEVKQRAPLQAYGAHGSAAGATHWPLPSHAAAGVYTFASQCSAAHSVPGL